jgi:hypothetical protein
VKAVDLRDAIREHLDGTDRIEAMGCAQRIEHGTDVEAKAAHDRLMQLFAASETGAYLTKPRRGVQR